MLRFPKDREPNGLRELRSTPGASWASVDGDLRAEMRERLTAEQRGLCAYCQRAVDPNAADRQGRPAMTIEHWTPRSTGLDELTWGNLLGVCSGRTDLEVHCGEARGDRPLTLHPVEGRGVDPRPLLRYHGDGRVTSDHPAAVADISVLNLDALHLRRGRKAVIEGMRRQFGEGRRSAADLKRLMARLDSGRPAPEYVEVSRYQLVRWLERRR